MHEIGVLFEIVKTVEKFAAQNQVETIQTLVLQVGELSSMVPRYLENLYPVAVEGSILEGSELNIEILTANGICRDCNKVFPIVSNKGTCPTCSQKNVELLSGKEFYIKEIVCC
ncbi:MAG: hydrogenase maturation nickel metallochaperone HypA [Anaerocolumna sp.]